MPPHSASHSQLERQSLADALLQGGPDAPTLCAGWTARDLAAHLVVREARPDAALGIVLPPLAGYGEWVRERAAARPFEELVQQFRSGPPLVSWARMPKVDQTLNFGEYFVHCEDVLRARPDWSPRALPDGMDRALWAAVNRSGKLMFRRARSGITLVWPAAGKERVLKPGDQQVILRGEPGELVLYAYGRGEHADVSVEGPDDAVAAMKSLELGL